MVRCFDRLGRIRGVRGRAVALKDTFKEPTILSLFASTILAIFQFLNSFGQMDNIAGEFWPSVEVDGTHEKLLIIPSGRSLEFWGDLQPGTQDYAIVAILLYTLISIWAHRPIEPVLNPKKRWKLLNVKSTRWFKASILFLLIAILSTANKKGVFAKILFNLGKGPGTGIIGRSNGNWEFKPLELGIADYLEVAVLYSLFVFAIWKGLEIDRSTLEVLSDKRNAIEKVWDNVFEAERESRTNVDEGASKINEAFKDLVNMLNAATTMNVAASSLDQGNVKGAFNKWKNLTHRKGKLFSDWQGLSGSMEQMGKFDEETKEEEE